MPVDIQNTQLSSDLMALQNLEWHNGSIAQHIASHTAVEDLQRSIIGSIRKEWIATTGMELDCPDSLLVVPEGLVRALGEIEIVPEQTTIVRADDDVVTA